MECEIVGTVALGSPDVVARMQDHGSTRVRLCDVADHEQEVGQEDEGLYACAVAVKYRFDQGLPVACACLGLESPPPDPTKSTTPEVPNPEVPNPIRRWTTSRLANIMKVMLCEIFALVLLAVGVGVVMSLTAQIYRRAHIVIGGGLGEL